MEFLTGSSKGASDIVEALGIDPKNGVTKLTFTIEAAKPATIDVVYESYVIEEGTGKMAEILRHYELVERSTQK